MKTDSSVINQQHKLIVDLVSTQDNKIDTFYPGGEIEGAE